MKDHSSNSFTSLSPSQKVQALAESIRLQKLSRLFEECPSCLGKLQFSYDSSGENFIVESGTCCLCGHQIPTRQFRKH